MKSTMGMTLMMRGTKCVPAAVLLLSLAMAGWADILVLRNGDRIEGEIVDETPTQVSIRRVFKGGKIRYVDKIKRADIARIEKTDIKDAPISSESTASRPEQATSTQPSLSADEQQEILASALARLKKKDYEIAGMYLSRLINNSPRGQLPELSAEIERKFDMSLADLAAEIHIRAAIKKSKGRGFRLQYVTDYEVPSLIPRLIDAYKNALTQKSQTKSSEPSQNRNPRSGALSKSPRDRSPSTQPVGRPERAYAITDFLDKPKNFDGDKEDARAFNKQIRYALGLLSERMRFDTEVKQNRTLRSELMGDKKRLLDLYKAVLARAEGALTPQEQEAREAEIQRRQEQMRHAAELEEMRHQRYLRRAIRMAQEQEQYRQPEGPPE